MYLFTDLACPDQGFDRLAARDPDMRKEVSGYVRWKSDGFGGLAVAERAGGMRDSCNQLAPAYLRVRDREPGGR